MQAAGVLLVKPRRIAVTWWDSASSKGWTQPEDVPKKALICRSVGWLVRDTKHGLVITTSITEDGAWHEPLMIPRGAIRSVKRL